MSNLFYRQPRLLVLCLLLIMVSGMAAYNLLPRKEDPSLTKRNALILTRFPGADAERVESLVTEKIETELQKIEEVGKIVSTSRTGISVVNIELYDTITDTDAVWSRLRDRLDDVTPLLPAGAREPEFNDTDTEIDAYTFITALTWDNDSPVPYAILRRLAEELEDQFRALPGTKNIKLAGDPEEEIRVELDPTQLASLNLTSADIAQALRRTDAKVAAGQLRHRQNDLLIEVEGKLSALDRVRRTPIRTGSAGQVVQLGDIATVTKTIAEPPSDLALFDGRPGIAVAVRMEPSRRIDQWAVQAHRVHDRMAERLPQGISLQIVFDQSRYVETRLWGLQLNLLLGAILVVVVIFVMMGWKAALLVGLALPLSSLMVLSGMRLLGIPIHQMSVTGLIVALGILIDNAIITVDEVHNRLRQGQAPGEAVASSFKHLLVPLLGSTLTTVLAFMPLVLMPGGAGEFVGPIGMSVILALLSSFFVALTIVASLAGLAHRPHDYDGAPRWWRSGFANPRLTQAYRRILTTLLQRPVVGALLAVLLPVAGFLVSGQLEEQFFPPSDRDQFQLQLTLPSYASLQRTERLVEETNSLLKQRPEIKHVHWFVGGNAPKFYYNMLGRESDAAYYAQALVQLHSSDNSFELIRTIQTEMDQRFPQAQILAKQLEQGPPFNAPIEMHIFGPDFTRLQQLGTQVREILSQVPDVIHTHATLTTDRPKLWVKLDSEEARLAGLDNVGVAEQLQQSLEGAIGGSLIEGTEELPVRVRLAQSTRSDLSEIASLDLLPTDALARAQMAGNGIPIQAIGQLNLIPELARIPHRDGERANTVQGFIIAGVLPATVQAQFVKQLQEAQFVLPPGYRYEYGGEAGERDEAVGNLLASIGVLLVLMLATLVLSFNSFRMASLIAVVAGLSAGLSLGSLWLFGYPFGFTAIVGTMGLVGIAVNDAIVVLAALREHPQARLGHHRAVVEVVVHSSRHVFSTSITTIAGFTPLLIAGGGFWPPLAVAIAGGVAGATLLALFFIPSAYLLLLRRWAPQPLQGPAAEAAAPA